MLSLRPLQARVRNSWTSSPHSIPRRVRPTIRHKIRCSHKSGSTVQLVTEKAPTAAVISALTREHAQNLGVWKTYTNTNKVCKQKLLSLVPEVYYRTLKKKYTAYAGVTCLTFLTHLHREYGRLTSQDIDNIDKRMKSQISRNTEFEAFVQQFEDGQEAVTLQNPYTDIQIVTISKKLIENTRFYTMDCRE